MRGHGRSAQPTEAKDYESIRLAEDFKAVCDGFGVEKPVIAGWSIGGSIAVDVVAAYGGSYLSGVLYIGGAVLSLHERYLPKCVTPLIGELIPLLHSTDPDDISRASRIFVDSCTVPGKLTHQQKLQSLGSFVTQSRTSRTLHLSRTQPCEAWERQAADLPVLVIQGTEDQHCLYENMIQLAKGVYKDVEVRLIEGVGHSPSIEAPGETNKYILEWVTKIAARQAQA